MTKKKDRRSEILQVAAELFAQRGVAATTVREIADGVGMLSGSLYHHFGSKDAIAEEIVLDYLRDIEERYCQISGDGDAPATRLALLIRASLEASVDHPHATEVYQNNLTYLSSLPSSTELSERAGRVQAMWLETIDAGVAAGVFRADIPAGVFYRLLRDSLWLSVRWYRPDGQFSISQMAEACTALYLEGFLTRD